jgi:hypothetical protein
MKKQFKLLLIFFSALLLLAGCNNDSDDEQNGSEVPQVKSYYSYKTVTDSLLVDGDTITVALTDTFQYDIRFENITVSRFVLYNSFSSESAGDYSWLLSTEHAGVYNLGAYIYDQDRDADFTSSFYVNVPSVRYRALRLTDPVYVIDVADEQVKNEIGAELDNYNRLPLKREIIFEGTSTTGGTYSYTTSDGLAVTGLFSTSDIFNIDEMNISFDDLDIYYTLTGLEGTSTGYLFSQDLTEMFQANYPSETINEVSLSFQVSLAVIK